MYIFSALLIYIIFGFFLFIFQRRIVFNVIGIPQEPAYYGLNNIEIIKIITSDDIELLGWFSKAKSNKPTLIYLHGNSFDIGERAYRIQRYLNEGWGVLLFAWRGYSGNKGNPTENNLYKDAESALKWIEKNTYLQKSDLVIYGESLGTGVAVELGTRYLFKSIVLEAPFTSISDIAQKKYKIYPVKFFVLDKFDNYKKITKVFSPLLIISGMKDEVIPHSHSVKLFTKANDPKDCLFIGEAMHNNLYDFNIDKKVINFNS